MRADRCREWAAELPAILEDQSIRPSFLRALRALTFCVGISRTTRQLSRRGRAGSRQCGAHGRAGPAAGFRAVGPGAWPAGLVWLLSSGVVALLRTHPIPAAGRSRWPWRLAIAFDAFCLVDIARAGQVRYLPKWAWVLVCLAQTPGGGIAYLSIGHVSRARSVPPGAAPRP